MIQSKPKIGRDGAYDRTEDHIKSVVFAVLVAGRSNVFATASGTKMKAIKYIGGAALCLRSEDASLYASSCRYIGFRETWSGCFE